METVSVFSKNPKAKNWVEIYHSKHGWAETQIRYKADGGEWVPYGRYKLIDAAHIRPGFRAFRLQASRLELRLTDNTNQKHEPKEGADPHLIDRPGRYVIGDTAEGIRRVGDADVSVCLRALRPNDKWLELNYDAPRTWRRVYVEYIAPHVAASGSTPGTGTASAAGPGTNGASNGRGWGVEPMEMKSGQSGFWFHRAEILHSATFKFTDGGGNEDNNNGKLYHAPMAGKYAIRHGEMMYVDRANADEHRERSEKEHLSC